MKYQVIDKRDGRVVFESDSYTSIESWLLLTNLALVTAGNAPRYTWRQTKVEVSRDNSL